MAQRRKPPPIRVLVPVVFVIFSAVSLTAIVLLGLPWVLPIELFWSVGIGIIFLAVGFLVMALTLRSLTLRRAFGDELYMTKEESQLVTTGPYAYTRNPLYFSGTILLIGWTLFLRLTFLLILTMLFLPLFGFAIKWEEKELTERFGEEYVLYKERVPLFFPRLRRE
ncbi:MAG: methyltransferase family protein [Candidatus Thorarchaeota archaeon]